MELSQHYIQVLTTGAMIFGTTCVALMFDFLRKNNEQLRELVELTVRQEEEQTRLPVVTRRVPKPASKRAHIALAAPQKRTSNPEALAAMARGAALAMAGKRLAPVVKAPKKDWGTLLGVNAQQKLPAGFHQSGNTLKGLLRNGQRVSGLVVSIRVNAVRNADGSLPESVSKVVQSLLGPNDFAALSSDEEFLLVYSEDRGASARSRLSSISQKLWDFQVRSIGEFQILFSWGGVEVHGKSLEEAITSARERVQETKEGRKLLTMTSTAQACVESQLRKAV